LLKKFYYINKNIILCFTLFPNNLLLRESSKMIGYHVALAAYQTRCSMLVCILVL